MQKQQPGKSNLKFLSLVGTGANSMSRKHRRFFIALWLIAATLFTSASAQETNKSKPEQAPALQKQVNPPTTSRTNAEQEIINLSKEKWRWMSERKVDSLAVLFHEKAVFVHMGGSWGTEQELNIIKSGGIWYKKADIHEVSVNIIGTTAILLNRITLLAVVGGNEVTNPFMVTEVYVQQSGTWKLGSLSFTRLLGQ